MILFLKSLGAVLKEAIQEVLCDHDFEFQNNISDPFDKSIVRDSYWRCRHCTKDKVEKQAYNRNTKTGVVTRMTEPERAYHHGYMSILLRQPESDRYKNDPVIEESYYLGRQLAEWDEQDRYTKDSSTFSA